MRIQIAGRQMDVGEALRTRIENDLANGVGKYFNRATDAVVTVGKNGGGIGMAVDCLVHLPSGISLQAEGHGGDAHSAFDDALVKLEKRVRRYKRRLRNHHADNKSPLPAEDASSYVLAPLEEEAEDDGADAPANGEAAPLGDRRSHEVGAHDDGVHGGDAARFSRIAGADVQECREWRTERGVSPA